MSPGAAAPAAALKLVLFRLLAVAGLALSFASLLDSVSGTGVFCGFEGGCGEVTASRFGKIGPVPLPALGLAAFGLFFCFTFLPPFASLLGPMALLAGVAGVALVALQAFVLKSFCVLCLFVDAAALCLALVELAFPGRVSVARGRRWPWGLALLAAFAGPLLFTWLRPPLPIPDEVRARRISGKVNLFLITDFQCPQCRRLHESLGPALAESPERFSLWLEPLPLPQHPQGRIAARAYWHARNAGKGRELAHLLFATEDLSLENLVKLGNQVGLQEKSLRAALAQEELDSEIAAATAWVDRRRFRGLPILWIEDEALAGYVDETALRAALARALRGLPH